jgi:hypothetical protein
MRWLTLSETAEALDWDADALARLLSHTKGSVLPGALQEDDGSWSVPESAVRRITGAGLRLFSVPTLADLIDGDAGNLRRLIRAKKLAVVVIKNVGQRVPWSEYQRLLGRAKTCEAK